MSTRREPSRKRAAKPLRVDHHDTVVRIAAPKREDGYSRFFWLLVAAVLAALGLGVSAFIRDRDAAIVIRTKVEHHDSEIAALKSQSSSFASTVSDLRNVARDLGELRAQLTQSVTDRYTGSQAAVDRAAIADRISRIESTCDDFALFKARVDEWLRTRGGPQSSSLRPDKSSLFSGES